MSAVELTCWNILPANDGAYAVIFKYNENTYIRAFVTKTDYESLAAAKELCDKEYTRLAG